MPGPAVKTRTPRPQPFGKAEPKCEGAWRGLRAASTPAPSASPAIREGFGRIPPGRRIEFGVLLSACRAVHSQRAFPEPMVYTATGG